MWATLPPVVSVVTAADELTGVSVAAHTSGMLCESNTGSCPPFTTAATRRSRPYTADASSVMSPCNASLVSDEHSASLNGSQSGYFHHTAFPPAAVGDGAACETAVPVAPSTVGRPWSRLAPLGSQDATPPLRQLHLERSSFSPLASPRPVEAPTPAPSSPAADFISESLTSRRAAAFPSKGVPDCGLSRSPGAYLSMSVVPVDTRPSPTLVSPCASSFHLVQPSFCTFEQTVVAAAAKNPARGAAYVSAVMRPSESLCAAPKSTPPPTSSDAMVGLGHPAPTGAAGSPNATYMAVNSFQGWSRVPFTAPVPTIAAGDVGAPPGAVIESEAQNNQALVPLVCPPCPTPAPHASAIVSGGALKHSSTPVSPLLNARGSTGCPASVSAALRTPFSMTPVCLSCSPPRHQGEGLLSHSRHAPPLSVWGVGGASLNSTGTAFTVATAGGMTALSPQTPPQIQHFASAKLSSSGSTNTSIGDVGHVHFQALGQPHSPPSLHSPSPRLSSHPSVGARTSPTQPDDSFISITLPNHNQSFYTGTAGRDSLHRSFLFPLNSPGVTAVAAGGVAYSVSDAGPSLEAGSILVDPFCSPALFELPELQPASQQLQGPQPSHQPHPQLQQPLLITPTAAAALSPPGPHLTVFSRSPQLASLDEALQPYASARDRCSSLSQSPALLQLSTCDLQSSSVAAGAEASRNESVRNTSFFSPTVANLQWRCRFGESLSGSEKTLAFPDRRLQMTGSSAASAAAGCRCDGASAKPSSMSISNSKLTPRPAYIVEWEQSLIAFQNRAESYYTFKNTCTETYLTLIEHNVDRFLVCYFSGGVIRPEKSLQEALTSRSGPAVSTAAHVLGWTNAVRSTAKEPSASVAGGGGIQKMLPGSKTLLRLGETGSKWLTKIGANLRRTAETPTPVSRESQTPLMSAGPASRATVTSADAVVSPQRCLGEDSSDCGTASMTVGAAGAGVTAMGGGVLGPTCTGPCDTDPFGAHMTPNTVPGRPTLPETRDSIPSTSTSRPPLPPQQHTELTADTCSTAPTNDMAFLEPVTAEEAEMQCLRQLGPYVANVVPETFMDARPCDGVLDQVRRNYAILLHTLQHVFLNPDGRSRRAADTSLPRVDQAPSSPAALTPTPLPTAATGLVDSSHSTAMDGLISQRIRHGLLLPTIQATWRDYLTPLECKAQELVQIAKTIIGPILGQLQAPCDTSATCSAAAVSLSAPVSPVRDLPCDLPAAVTTLAEGTSVLANATTNTDRSARETLRASWVDPVSRLIRLLGGDEEYLATIHRMDDEFVENGKAWQECSAQMRLPNMALSDYVPVYGLVLSRLHRLEMEHRTVLELWGGSAAGTQRRTCV
ncbi:hypothetical protein Q4I30_004078 [Leishmania utingensis]|uniref:Uncharacterized protein n=1 Tax=Leishmania utingensis TaxID=653362 RepID=A0AAW3AJ36_9TRYP